MAFTKRLAYYVCIAIMLVAPTWGCNSDPPAAPPPEASEAEQEGGTDEPTVELGDPSGTTADDAGGTDDPSGG